MGRRPDRGSPAAQPIGWLMAVATVVPAAVLAVRAWPVRGPELVLQSFEHPSLDGVFSTGFVLVLALSVVALAAQPRLAHHRAGTAAGRPTDPRLRARRRAEGRSARMVRRCRQRVVARQLFKLLER